MRKPTMSFEEVKRALARQNEQLEAAYAAVEAGKSVPIDPSALHALEDLCGRSNEPRAEATPNSWNAVRC